MKAQMFEMMFYPVFAFLFLQFFRFQSEFMVSDALLSESVLSSSDRAVAESNRIILNTTPDHLLEYEVPQTDGGYRIRRFVTDGRFVKELILTVPD